MSTRPSRNPTAVLVLLAALSTVAPGAAETVTFAFAPPVGQPLEVRQWGLLAVKWGGNKQEIAIGGRASWNFARDGAGYHLAERTLEIALAKDGKPHEDPILDAFQHASTGFRLAGDGALRRLEGARRNQERMIALLEGDAKKNAEKRLEEGRIGESEIWGWFDRYEIFAGQTLELDRDYWFRSAFPADDGWVPVQVLFRLGPWEQTPHGRRLRLQVAYSQNAHALIPEAQEIRPKVRTRFDPEKPGKLLRGYEIRGNASRLVDPATGLIWRDQTFVRVASEIRPIEEIGITVAVEARTDFTLAPAAP